MPAKAAKTGDKSMAVSQLKAQIIRDSEAVSKISERSRDSYCRELRATLDRGASYRFTANAASK
jgi:hypothetical protein